MLPYADPIANNSKRVEEEEEDRGFYVQDMGNAPDGALQADYSRSITSFEAMKTFEGVSITDIFNAVGISPIPPDPAIAVGPMQVVEMTNGAYQVYDKETGQGLLEAPMALANIWTGGDDCKYVVCTPIPSAVFCLPQSIDFCKKNYHSHCHCLAPGPKNTAHQMAIQSLFLIGCMAVGY
jgi:hypothetical protein